jgi:hypothetical protein
LALWEGSLQHLQQQLNPAVFSDWQHANHFRASSDSDRNNGESGGLIHAQQEGGLASNLETRCSTVDNLPKVSLRSSFISL